MGSLGGAKQNAGQSDSISPLFNYIALSSIHVGKSIAYSSIEESGALPSEGRIDQEGLPRELL